MLTRRAFTAASIAVLLPGQGSSAAAADLADLSLMQAAALLRAGTISPVDLVQACLARIEALEPTLNAFITVTAEQALATAREQTRRGGRGRQRGGCTGFRSRSRTTSIPRA